MKEVARPANLIMIMRYPRDSSGDVHMAGNEDRIRATIF
jgi:hypothetical protein